jgi:hypothetical protein
MSLLNTQSRARMWPLKGDQGEAPAWAPSSSFDFSFKNVPKLTKGKLANYMPAVAITAWGTYTAAEEDTGRITWEDLTCALYQNFEIQGAWHGRPIAGQHVRSATARIWELISMGYQGGARRQGGQRSSTQARPFRHTLYLPLCHALGKNGARYTSQLSVLYKDATLYITTPANGQTAATIPAVLTLANVSFRASAVLLPEPCIRIAPGVEWLELQTKGAATGSDPVDLEALGNATGLEGVEPGAGIDTMLALCNKELLAGSFTLDTLIQYSAPFLDQTQTKHLDPFLQMLEQVSSKGERPRSQQVGTSNLAAADPVDAGMVVDRSGFPYAYDAIADTSYDNADNGAKLPNQGLCFPLIVSGPELELTKIQRFEGTVTYYRQATITNSIDRTLVHQYKSWTPQKHEDFRQLVIGEGLAEAVLGAKDIVPKGVRNESGAPMDPALGRFFPVEWVRPGEPEKKA